jgi:hypothetical protein
MRTASMLLGIWTALFLSLAFAFTSVATAKEVSAYFFDIRSPEANKSYVVAAISPPYRPDWPEPTPGWFSFSNQLLVRVHHWLVDQFRLSYPQLDPAFFDRMLVEDSLADGRSDVIVVFKDKSLREIEGVLRFAHTDAEHPRLPLETMFHWSYPRPPLTAGERPIGFKPDGSLLLDKAILGKVVEVKNFVVAHGAGRDVVPILFYQANLLQLHTDNRNPRGQVPRVLSDNGHETAPIYPARYILACDESMTSYYERIGFSLHSPDPVQGKNYVMEADPMNFAKIWIEHFSRRRGAEIAVQHQSMGYEFFEGMLRDFRATGFSLQTCKDLF